jgi:ABC-2 type transport system ATP-binding protein
MMDEPDEPVIQTDGLTKRFGAITAVDDLSMEVRRGHIYGLLGPNGSGKTTTMGMLLGVLRPTSGSFRLFGSTARHREALRRVGAVIESPAFYPNMSGRENLEYFRLISGRGSSADVDDVLQKVGLAGRGDDRFHTYSQGMKQRLGIGYALLGDPELVCLDEPTNGLDPEGMIQVRELIRSLGDGSRTVLLSSHLLHEIEQVCDRVTIISKGKLVVQGEVAELVRADRDELVRVKTTDDAKAREILSALDWVGEVGTTEDGALSVAAPIERSGELTAAMSRSEVYVTEMAPVGRSLEQYFLEVTGSD